MSERVRKLSPHGVESQQGIDEGEAKTDIASIMAEIRKRIKADIEGSRDARPSLSSLMARFEQESGVRHGDLQHSEVLRFLNQNYALETKLTPAVIPTHRKGLLGKLVPLFKRVSRAALRKVFLADYLMGERQFTEHLVRHLNHIGKYIDARNEDLTAGVRRQVERIDHESSAMYQSISQHVERLGGELRGRIAQIDSVVRGLEGVVNNFPVYTNDRPPRVSENVENSARPDLSYLLLENRYRGSEAEIAQRLSIYPAVFEGAKLPVLEIGSGRGELQRLFAASGVPSYGVDLDVVMVNFANSRGCKTHYGDGIAHLRSVADGSLGGVIAIQVVEHLTRAQLKELCELVKVKVAKSGKIVFETINPQSLLALSSNYFRDPTHVWPMHPDTLGYIATMGGLSIVETRYLSPVPEQHLLQEIVPSGDYPSDLMPVIHHLNDTVRQLNRLIYGFQDYCLILEVP